MCATLQVESGRLQQSCPQPPSPCSTTPVPPAGAWPFCHLPRLDLLYQGKRMPCKLGWVRRADAAQKGWQDREQTPSCPCVSSYRCCWGPGSDGGVIICPCSFLSGVIGSPLGRHPTWHLPVDGSVLANHPAHIRCQAFQSHIRNTTGSARPIVTALAQMFSNRKHLQRHALVSSTFFLKQEFLAAAVLSQQILLYTKKKKK